MRYVIAFDSFKGSMTAVEACETARDVIEELRPGADVTLLPMSDGGDGMLEAYAYGRRMERRWCNAHDALMRPCTAGYLVDGDRAIIESAQACGLLRVKDEPLRPLQATSYGVGELVADAIRHKCRHLVVGLGGSACSDDGIGMLQALKEHLLRMSGIWQHQLRTWDDVPLPDGLDITLACDVDNPLYGERGAAAVFGPQKGATADDIRLLDRKARTFAALSARHLGHDCSLLPGAGAAGGLGYAFMQYLGARLQPGAELMLALSRFDEAAKGAVCILTGEGSADSQTLMGKMPSAVLRHGRELGIPVVLLAGRVTDREALLQAGFDRVEAITPEGMTPEEAMRKDVAKKNLKKTVEKLIYSVL